MLSRVHEGTKSVARRLAAHVLRQEFSLAPELESVPLERLLRHYYDVWKHLHDRINEVYPNFKLRRDGVFSFFDFIANHINKGDPVRVIDLGAADCYLASLLSEEMHAETHFDCVDIKRPDDLRLTPQISFIEKDVLSMLQDITFSEYDYAIASGFLGVLSDQQTSMVLDALTQCPLVFIRENPKMTNLIDAFCGAQLDSYRPWPDSFTEHSLKDALTRHGFNVLAVEHEYDIYILAAGQQRS